MDREISPFFILDSFVTQNNKLPRALLIVNLMIKMKIISAWVTERFTG